jgi:hypothetical protein
VKPLNTRYAGIGNGLEVCVHALPRHVVANEMKPCLRPENLGRSKEILFILKAERGVQNICRGLNGNHLGPEGAGQKKGGKGEEDASHGLASVLYKHNHFCPFFREI